MAYQLSAFGYTLPREIDRSRFIIVRDSATFERVIRGCMASPYLVFDFETSGLAWYAHAEACGIALGWCEGDRHFNAYIPYRHRTGERQMPAEVVLRALKPLLENNSFKIGHNLKFDMHIARRDGIEVNGPLYDTAIASVLYDENDVIGLKPRAVRLIDPDAAYWEDEMDRMTVKLAAQNRMGKKAFLSKYGYALHPIELTGAYAAYDSEYTWLLYCYYEWRVGVSRQYPRVFAIEMTLIRALLDMETEGLPVDVPYLQHIKHVTNEACGRLDDEIRQLTAPYTFDVSKDDQLRDYCLQVLRLPLKQKTDKDKLSVDYDALAPFKKTHPVIQKVLDRRAASKLGSTYTDSILKRLSPKNHVHCDLRQVGTVTGRLASADPNMQNVASDDDDRAIAHSGKKVEDGGIDPWSIKRAFPVPKGYVRLFADYSQVELRMAAHYSRDPLMVGAYVRGEDLHAVAMREINRPRRTAKVMNFGLAFGLTVEGLARQAEISMAEAESAYAVYFQRFSGFATWRDRFWLRCRLDGNRFQNMWGRPRRLWDLQNPEKHLRRRAERQAVASLIQGTAAELTKESIVRIWQWQQMFRGQLDIKLRLTVHDEIQLDCLIEQEEYVSHWMKHYMEAYPEFGDIPIIAEVSRSVTTWADKA